MMVAWGNVVEILGGRIGSGRALDFWSERTKGKRRGPVAIWRGGIRLWKRAGRQVAGGIANGDEAGRSV